VPLPPAPTILVNAISGVSRVAAPRVKLPATIERVAVSEGTVKSNSSLLVPLPLT